MYLSGSLLSLDLFLQALARHLPTKSFGPANFAGWGQRQGCGMRSCIANRIGHRRIMSED